jgi:hypothetical protein
MCALLDRWATNQAPAASNKYGTLAWVRMRATYQIQPPTPPSGTCHAEQAEVPDAIKQARMNLYLVQCDRSFGVHNGRTLVPC